MKTYTIAQKMTNTGSIHDLASQHYEREIRFPAGTQYAVVRAAYYGERSGANIYTTHRSEEAAATTSRKLSHNNISHEVIDAEGHRYTRHGNELYRIN